MNQVTNLIQWKNHTDEQKKDFDFENYRYTVQTPTNTKFFGFHQKQRPVSITDFGSVYRLVIEDDKWYTYFSEKFSEKYTVKGSEFTNPDRAICLRPAKPDEIPQDERTLERKIEDQWPDKEVVMLTPENGMLLIVKTIEECELDSPHVNAQSIKGYAGYVYDLSVFIGGDIVMRNHPSATINGSILQPVAVLFER